MMFVMWIGMALALAVLLAVGVWVVHHLTDQRGGEARRILEERFIRGEIDTEEFERRRRLLEE